MLRSLKFHSLAWESDRQVSATEFYCSIIFVSDLNESPLKIRKRGGEFADRRAQCLAICSPPVALMFPVTQFNVLSSQLSSAVPKRHYEAPAFTFYSSVKERRSSDTVTILIINFSMKLFFI